VYVAVAAREAALQGHSPETCGIRAYPSQTATAFLQEPNEIVRKALKTLSGTARAFYGDGAHTVVRRPA